MTVSLHAARAESAETLGDEQALASRIRAGDTAAFEALYRSIFSVLTRVAARYVESTEAAEDVVQDVFADFWQRREQLDVRTTLLGYLAMAVRHRAGKQTAWRKRAKADALADHVAVQSPADELEQRELEAACAAAFAALAPRARTIARLKWFDRLTRSDIAERLGITVETVHTQLTLARRAIRRHLKTQGHSPRS